MECQRIDNMAKINDEEVFAQYSVSGFTWKVAVCDIYFLVEVVYKGDFCGKGREFYFILFCEIEEWIEKYFINYIFGINFPLPGEAKEFIAAIRKKADNWKKGLMTDENNNPI